MDKTFYYDLYTYVESGFPVLISYKGHAAILIGHTLDKHATDHIHSDNNIIDSFNFLKEFVVINDNFFPYRLLGYKGENNYWPKDRPINNRIPCIDNIYSAVVPLPEKVFLPANDARYIANESLKAPGIKLEIQRVLNKLDLPEGEHLVTRLFLTSVSSYKRKKLKNLKGIEGDFDDLSRFTLQVSLPHFIWVMEISPISLYRQYQCIGEIVFDSLSSKNDNEIFYIRIGNSLYCKDKKLHKEDWTMKYPIYTHNLGEVNL